MEMGRVMGSKCAVSSSFVSLTPQLSWGYSHARNGISNKSKAKQRNCIIVLTGSLRTWRLRNGHILKSYVTNYAVRTHSGVLHFTAKTTAHSACYDGCEITPLWFTFHSHSRDWLVVRVVIILQ